VGAGGVRPLFGCGLLFAKKERRCIYRPGATAPGSYVELSGWFKRRLKEEGEGGRHRGFGKGDSGGGGHPGGKSLSSERKSGKQLRKRSKGNPGGISSKQDVSVQTRWGGWGQ